MKRWMMLLALAVLVCTFGLTGCQSAAFESGERKGQGLKASYTSTGGPGYLVITHRDGRIEIVPIAKEVSREK